MHVLGIAVTKDSSVNFVARGNKASKCRLAEPVSQDPSFNTFKCSSSTHFKPRCSSSTANPGALPVRSASCAVTNAVFRSFVVPKHCASAALQLSTVAVVAECLDSASLSAASKPDFDASISATL